MTDENNNHNQWVTKQVRISGLTEGMRQADFERKKETLSKSGWEAVGLHDDGMSKSHAIFRRPLNYKVQPFRPTKKHVLVAVFAFLFVAAIMSEKKPTQKAESRTVATQSFDAQTNKQSTLSEERGQPPRDKIVLYKDYMEKLSEWSKKVDLFHQLAFVSSQETKDAVQLFQDVEKARDGIESHLSSMPSNPDSETQELNDAILRTHYNRHKAWSAMAEYIEKQNIRDLSEFKKNIEASERDWKMAVVELTKLKLKVQEMERDSKHGAASKE